LALSRIMCIISHALDQAKIIAGITNALMFFKSFNYV